MKEAHLYESVSESSLQCNLCPYLCAISPSRHGQCGVRLNRNGTLYAITYGRISTKKVIPIESAPLYHFHPGTRALLLGSMGCTMRCPFCNTWRVSQMGPRTQFLSPEELVAEALEKGVQGVFFGVNEPVVFYEYILDASPLLRKAGLYVALQSNGFMTSRALFQLMDAVDAIVVDVKGYDDHFYRSVTGGYRGEIMKNIISINQKKHLEISALVIGGKNDDDKNMETFFKWLAARNPVPPLHLIRYEPSFQYKDLPATDPLRMYYLQETAKRILPFVYLSNMKERGANDTFCPECHALLISRSDQGADFSGLEDGKCKNCGASPAFVLK